MSMSRSDTIDAALNQAGAYHEMARTARSFGFKDLAKWYDQEALRCERWAAKQ